MVKALLFGRSGKPREELSWVHWRMRWLFTWCNVVLVNGESWPEYKREWMR